MSHQSSIISLGVASEIQNTEKGTVLSVFKITSRKLLNISLVSFRDLERLHHSLLCTESFFEMSRKGAVHDNA